MKEEPFIDIPKIVEIEDITDILEIQSVQTKYYPIVVDNNRITFTISDVSTTTQDLAFSCWFSNEPFFFNIPYINSDVRKAVQQVSPLVISIKSKNFIDEVSPSLASHTITVEDGEYFFNIENRSGGLKRAVIDIEGDL